MRSALRADTSSRGYAGLMNCAIVGACGTAALGSNDASAHSANVARVVRLIIALAPLGNSAHDRCCMVALILLVVAWAQATTIPRSRPPAQDYSISAVPLTAVRIVDGFWAP